MLLNRPLILNFVSQVVEALEKTKVFYFYRQKLNRILKT